MRCLPDWFYVYCDDARKQTLERQQGTTGGSDVEDQKQFMTSSKWGDTPEERP
jgi:hypothetical protein